MKINVVRAYLLGMKMKESYGGWLWMVWIVLWFFGGYFIDQSGERIVIWPVWMWHWYTWVGVIGLLASIAMPFIGQRIMNQYKDEISRGMICGTNGCRIIHALDKNQYDGKWLWYNFTPPKYWAEQYPWKYHINNKEATSE